MRPVHAALGATHPRAGDQITIFIPDRDRNGDAIDQEQWTDAALAVLGRLFRGATAFPPGKGVWRDDSRKGALLQEITVMVVSYVSRDNLYKNLKSLRTFLHLFGRQANQGEVGVIIGGSYYGISKYDDAEETWYEA